MLSSLTDQEAEMHRSDLSVDAARRHSRDEFFFDASLSNEDWRIADTVSRASKPRSTAAWATSPVSTSR
jgi:hypothetical protein